MFINPMPGFRNAEVGNLSSIIYGDGDDEEAKGVLMEENLTV